MVDARLEGLDSWYATGWKGLNVAVLGLGATGFSVADTLVELGSAVTVYAPDGPADTIELLDVIGAGFERTPLDSVPAALEAQAPDVVIVSPGLPPHNATVQWAVETSTVWGDIELAWRRARQGRPRPDRGAVGDHHGHEREDHDHAAHHRDVRGRRSACRRVRQHRRARPRRRP